MTWPLEAHRLKTNIPFLDFFRSNVAAMKPPPGQGTVGLLVCTLRLLPTQQIGRAHV